MSPTSSDVGLTCQAIKVTSVSCQKGVPYESPHIPKLPHLGQAGEVLILVLL